MSARLKESATRNVWMVLPLLVLLFEARSVPTTNKVERLSDSLVTESSPQSGVILASAPLTTTLYFPWTPRPLPILADEPIWSRTSAPAPTEVSLFRQSFGLGTHLKEAALEIFADTRYEVWLDGNWVGRGPARFSQKTHEYDVYPLGTLSPGSHQVAVLVEWAPNNRRSESVTPFLKAHIQGDMGGSLQVFARTGPDWKAQLSPAWQQDATLVHAWGLIGPTELLDLRRLPADWMKPTFDDSGWQAAVVKDVTQVNYQPMLVPLMDGSIQSLSDLSQLQHLETLDQTVPTANYRPRSIPFLENVPIPAKVIDSGLLSPGRRVIDLAYPASPTYTLPFTVTQTTSATLETLSTSGVSQVSSNIRLDGASLSWQSSGPKRPDVYAAGTSLKAGRHNLVISGIPAQGATFAITTQNIQLPALTPQQGVNAGRRLLFAEPISQTGVVTASAGTNLDLAFTAMPSYAVLDLGRTVHGRLVAEVKGPPGTIVDIGWDERLLADTLRPLPYPGSLHPQWDQVDSWVLDGTSRSISTLDARAGRYLLIASWGSGPVVLNNIQVYEERYPLNLKSEFHSSDPLLDKMWQVGVDTLDANMSDAYADPWRERGQWWGDSYVIDHANRVTFDDTGLLKRGIRFMAEAFTNGRPDAMAPNGDGNHMLDYGMLWVHSLQEYGQMTGDTQIFTDTYPTLKAFLNYLSGYANATSGLLDIPHAHWSQATYIDTFGDYSRYGQSTAVNAMYYGTLLKAALIADQVGDTASAQAWRQKADSVKNQVNALLFIPTEHRYLSSLDQGNPVPPSPHAQAWALEYGLVPENEIPQVAASLLELLSPDPASPNLQVYGMYWVLDSLGRSGQITQALGIIDSYYGRLLNLGATTWWENFNANQSYSQSLSHGWGSTPTWFLSTYVLGARRTGPESWSAIPSFEGVTNVTGTLPLQEGVLQIHWEKQDCSLETLDLNSPSASSGEAVIPRWVSANELTLDGAPIWQNGDPLVDGVTNAADGIHIPLTGGSHQVSVQTSCPAP